MDCDVRARDVKKCSSSTRGLGTDKCKDQIIKEDITFEETESLSHMNIWRENTPSSECRDPGAGAEQGFLRGNYSFGVFCGGGAC